MILVSKSVLARVYVYVCVCVCVCVFTARHLGSEINSLFLCCPVTCRFPVAIQMRSFSCTIVLARCLQYWNVFTIETLRVPGITDKTYPPVTETFSPTSTAQMYINHLKPTGHVMHHQQFNIQQLYALPTLYLCVLYLSENKQRLVPFTA